MGEITIDAGDNGYNDSARGIGAGGGGPISCVGSKVIPYMVSGFGLRLCNLRPKSLIWPGVWGITRGRRVDSGTHESGQRVNW